MLSHCSVKQADNHIDQFPVSPTKPKTHNPFTGKWEYINTIWYSSELTLAENGTFTFHDEGCYGQRFSQGERINNNGIILLTSFDSFKKNIHTQTKPEELAQHLPGPNDTIKVYLDNIQMQLKNDTLYCTGQNKFPEEAAFHHFN